MAEKGSSSLELASCWRPEYASYMVEGTPGLPYGGSTNYFNTVSPEVEVEVTSSHRWSTT